MFRAMVIAGALALGACSNTVSSLSYSTTGTVQAAASPTVGAVAATDRRKEEPRRLATIMGGFGNPLKTLDTAKPVKDEVADAVAQGLHARGLMAASAQAPFRLALVVHQFDADMIIGRTARINLTMTVLNPSGAAVYEDTVSDSESETKILETGIFADIADLQRLCQIVLNRAVDRLLDQPGFRAAVSR
jgi:uncharacterized lipoprotein YajG